MCVIAGYIGHQQAAPILLDMLKREEGFAGAFYTGIATVHEGRLHYAKVVGDAAALERETNARDFPGTIGIAHGRPAGGGDREWAHPFVDQDEKLAFIANGANGRFETDLNPAAHRLLKEGIHFRSATPQPPCGVEGRYRTRLPDGQAAHDSEVLCHLLAQALTVRWDSEQPLREAMVDLFDQWPEEIVALAVHADVPDQIAAADHNYPMVIGKDDQGAMYIASMGLAFPPEVRWRMRMAPNSSATIHRDGAIDIRPLPRPRFAMSPFPSALAVEQRVITPLRQRCEGLKADALMELTKPLWSKQGLMQKEVLVYELIETLLAENRVEIENRPAPGMLGQGTVPQFYVRWKWGNGRGNGQAAAAKAAGQPQPEGLQIREGCPADLEAVAQFTPQAFGLMTMAYLNEQYFGRPMGSLSWQERINRNVLQNLNKPGVDWIVAELDGQVVGYASYWFEPDRELAVVGYNAVHHEYQGRGIGTMLQREVINRIQQAGYQHWQVTTLAHDYPAQRVYEKLGFEEVARSVVYLRKPYPADAAK